MATRFIGNRSIPERLADGGTRRVQANLVVAKASECPARNPQQVGLRNHVFWWPRTVQRLHREALRAPPLMQETGTM